ncbi:MAG TPA: hypothetical protein VGZ47_08055 [Gemmataceae bacterium]|nr:hypothetical protein [Gemmataceae bacterium]
MSQILLAYLVPLIVAPLIGGGLLLVAFRIAGNRDVSFRQCWWPYLAAFVYGFFMLAFLGFFVHWQSLAQWKTLAIFATATWATHAIAIPLITRRRGLRDMLAQESAILVANLIFTAILVINFSGQ